MIGRTILHYEVLEQLGSGGMGVVYRAKDLKLGRSVALKFLSPAWTRDSDAEARFEREARTASALNHPNICTIYAIDEFEGQRFIAMELLEGQSLYEAIGRQPMPVDTVLSYAVQIADALDAAHGLGILHRDIKPANIFITKRGQVKVLDFGLAKLTMAAIDDAHETRAMLSVRGEALGTIGYMSPEQARAEPLDSRSDLFSFGVVLYEMLTGQQAFSGPSTAVVFDGILNHMPPPVNLIASDVPPALEDALTRALQKDREQRYQSAAEMRADLERVRRARETEPTIAPLSGSAAPAQSGARSSRHAPQLAETVPATPAAASAPRPPARAAPARAGVVAAAVVAAALGGVWWLTTRERAGAPPEAGVVAAPAPAATEPAPAEAAPEPSSPPPEPPMADAEAAAAATGRPARALGAGGETPPARPLERASARTSAAPAAARTTAPAAAGGSARKTAPARSAAAELFEVARAKYEARLYDQALSDLQVITTTHAGSTAAPAAYLLAGQIHEQQSRPDDAMAAYVELRSRHPASDASAEASYRQARLTDRSRRPDRVKAARDLLGAVPGTHAASAWAPRALALKAAIEARERIKEPDPLLGATVPASIATNRLIVERYPASSEAELALWQLGDAYDDLKRYDLAAAAFEDLATRFPATRFDAWWRAAETYDKRLKNKAAAREAYGKVPVRSSNYKDAQRRSR